MQPIGYWLAEAHAKIVACRDLLYTTVREFEAGTMAPEKHNICKAFIGETCFDVCVKLVQMWGGSGIMNSTGVNRYMRDARAKCVAECHWSRRLAIPKPCFALPIQAAPPASPRAS